MKINFEKAGTMKRALPYIIILFLTAFAACKEEIPAFEMENQLGTIAEYVYDHADRYENFIAIMEAGELVDALEAYNPYSSGYTLFIPSDSAFKEFYSKNDTYNSIDDLIADMEYTRALGRYHILNMDIRTNDFPFGAFPDTTLSGDLLTVGFTEDVDSTIYLINSEAPVTMDNFEASNGFVHEVGKVLEPIVFTGYELLASNPDYSIITEVFEMTGLTDKMALTINGETGERENQYTLLAEPDSVYNRSGIYTVQDLIDTISPESDDYTSPTNPLYQFGAYHIMEGRYFLDNFEGTLNYNTFASLPLRISAGLVIKINKDPGRVYDTIIENNDTTYIDYVEPFYNSSNVLSQNGPIHFINQVMYLYKPGLSNQLYQFHNDPVINDLKNIPNEYIFSDQETFSMLSWEGAEEIIYYKSGTQIDPRGNDYLQIEGDFTLTYTIPKILPGEYQVYFRAHAYGDENAVVELFIDGNKAGGIMNLTSSGNSTGNPYVRFNQNTVEFTEYETHTVTVRSLIPGILMWDFIEFDPV